MTGKIFNNNLQYIGQIFALMHLFGVNPKLRATKFDSEETRRIPLLCGVDILTDDYSVLSLCMHLTDRQMNGQTDRKAVARAHSNRVRCVLIVICNKFEMVRECKLVFITNRKLHMGFQLVPKLATLNDLECHNSPYFRLFRGIQ